MGALEGRRGWDASGPEDSGPYGIATPPRRAAPRPVAPLPRRAAPRPTPPPPLLPMPPGPQWAHVPGPDALKPAPAAPPVPTPPWGRIGLVLLAAVVTTALVAQYLVFGTTTGAAPTHGTTNSPAATTTTTTPRPTTTHSRSPKPTRTTASTMPPSVPTSARRWELPPRVWPALTPGAPTGETWRALQSTPLDAVAPVVVTGGPRPAVVADQEAWRAAVRAQWHCLHVSWTPTLKALGWSAAEPPVQFYPGRGSKSDCGYVEAPAFYCSAGTGTVFFGADHFDMAQNWDLSINEMVNHEYGHHLQHLAGVTQAKARLPQTDDLERRSELQAICWAGAMTWNNRSFDFVEKDLRSWQRRLDTMVVDGVHGSRESIQYWGLRGLYAQKMADCNTWLVDSATVS